MKDIMIDLETLGTGNDAAILSIGACYFDINTGEIGETFHQVMQFESVWYQDRKIEPQTVKWWMGQSKEAIEGSIVSDGTTLQHALYELDEFVNYVDKVRKDCRVWANGSLFDIAVLENAYRQLKTVTPWRFSKVMDVRTICFIAKGIFEKSNHQRKGIAHNALDDAIYQAGYVSKMYQKLKGISNDNETN